MKMLTILTVLMIASTACRDDNYPTIRDIDQRSIFLADPVEIDGKLYIPVEDSVCFSRMYEHNKSGIGAVSEAQQLDVYECDKIIGYEPEEYSLYTSWKNSLRRWMLRQN